MKIRLLFLSFILALQLFSCKKNDLTPKKGDLFDTRPTQKIENNGFEKIELNCEKNDGFVKECNLGDYVLQINETNQISRINFTNNIDRFTYDFGFYFEGIGSDVHLFKSNKTKILLFEFQFENISLIYAFKIENNKIELIDKTEFPISDGVYSLDILKKKDGDYLALKQGNAVIEKKISSNFNIQNLKLSQIEKETEDKNSWDGSYISEIEIVRGMDVHQLKLIFIIKNNLADLKIITENNISPKKLIIKENSEQKIVLSDEKNKEEYIIQKNGKNYLLSGQSVYLLNPPNDKYLIEKK